MLIEISFLSRLHLSRLQRWGKFEERKYHILLVFQATISGRRFFSDNGPVLILTEESLNVAKSDYRKQGKSTTKKRRKRRFFLIFLHFLRFFVVDFPQENRI